MKRSTLILLPTLAIFINCFGAQPPSPQALAQENACIQSLQIGDYQGAKTRCELCLEYNDKIPECINGLGLVAYGKQETAKAVDYFTKAIHMSQDFAQARNNLGAVYFRQGNFEEALPLFKAAVTIDPGYVDARYNYGLCLLRMGQKAMAAGKNEEATSKYTKALGEYRKLIAVNAEYANAYRDMGIIMTYQASMQTMQDKLNQQLNDADNYFKQCLQVDPQNSGCLESYGHTLLYQKQYDQALFQFVQCLAADSKNTVCIDGMNQAYQGSEMKSSALQNFMTELQNNPKNAGAHNGYCAALFQRNMNTMAISECETAIKLNPKLCSSYYQLAMYYKKALNSPDALSNCRSYVLCDQKASDASKVAQCQQVITTLNGK